MFASSDKPWHSSSAERQVHSPSPHEQLKPSEFKSLLEGIWEVWALKNVSSTSLKLCYKELRQFWRWKRSNQCSPQQIKWILRDPCLVKNSTFCFSLCLLNSNRHLSGLMNSDRSLMSVSAHLQWRCVHLHIYSNKLRPNFPLTGTTKASRGCTMPMSASGLQFI